MKFLFLLLGTLVSCALTASEPRGKSLFEANRTVPAGMGVNIHFFDNEAGMEALRSIGAKWLRMDFTWARIESEKGIYDFSKTDKLMKAAAARGIRILAILDYGNKLYEPERKLVTESGRRAFADYAAALVRRYAGYGAVWEIWNEPNNGGFWPGNNPLEYMALMKTAVPAIRAADPEAVILGPSTYRVDLKYMEVCLKEGLLELVDAVSFHPYRRHHPEMVLDDVAELRGLMERYCRPGRELPAVVCSEWGFSATQHPEGGQALRMPRAALLSMMAGIDLYIYYDLWNDGEDPANSEHNYGLFTSPPFLVEKPAALAFKTLAKVLGGFRFSRRIGAEANPNRFLLEFVSPSGEKRYAHWSDDGKTHEWVVPEEFGTLSRVTMSGQKQSGVYRPGDRLVSTPETEYLVFAEESPATWKTLAVLLPSATLSGPWQAEPGEDIRIGTRIATGVRDLEGAVDYWFQPDAADFGKTVLTGGDLDKPFPTIEFRLDKEGRPSARHWVWQLGKKWLPALGTNEAVLPGQWVRITYCFGTSGRRLYINGQLVDSVPSAVGSASFAFHIAPSPLKGKIGRLKVISGKGFKL